MPTNNLTRLSRGLLTNINTIAKKMITPEKPKPLGRWMVNDSNWKIRAEYATSDSCGGDLCRKNPPKYPKN
jgi:hypothetical protein